MVWIAATIAGIAGVITTKQKTDSQERLADKNTRTTAVEDLLRRIGSVSTQAEQLKIFEEAFGTEITNQLRQQGTITSETRATSQLATQARQLAEQVNTAVNTAEITEIESQLQTATSTEEIKDIESQLQIATEEQATVQRGDVGTQAALGALQAELGELPDTAAAIDAAINRVLRSGLPAVTNVLAQSGGFDSTTAAILQNDLIQKAAESAATLQLQAQETNIAQRLAAIQAGQAATEITTGVARTEEERVAREAATGTTETAEQRQERAATESLAQTTGTTTQLEDIINQLSEVVDVETLQQIEELVQVETETTQTTTSEQERLVQEQTLQEEIVSTVSDEFIDVGVSGATVVPGTTLSGAIAGAELPELRESTLPPLPGLTLLPEADIPIPEPTIPLPPQTRTITESGRRVRLAEEEELSNLLNNRLTGRSTLVR